MLETAGAPSLSTPAAEVVLRELDRIGGSRSFRRAEQCLRLLGHITRLTLEGHNDGELKEYALGVTVFQRPESYDPRIDPVVRLEARRLRLKLAEYYQDEGIDDPVVIDLPKGGYVPQFRFRRVPESEVEAPPEPITPQLAAPPRGYRDRRIWLAVTAVLLVAAVGSWFAFRKLPQGLPVRASVAVLGFRDLSGHDETSWISSALSEAINVDLGKDQRLRALPLDNVSRMQRELSLLPQPTYSTKLLQRIRTNLESDYVVTGSYLRAGNRIHLNAMLFDTRSGLQLAAISNEADDDKLPEIAALSAGRIRARLGLRELGTESRPFEASALEPFARGMQSLREGDPFNARTFLEKAAAAAPSNPLVRAGLAQTYLALGMDIQAGEEAHRAFNGTAAMGRVEQLEIEGLYRTITNDWPRAIQVYQALVTLFPDDLEYGLRLAAAETSGGKGQDALGVVHALGGLPPPLGSDPRIDMAEARAAGALSDFAHTRKAAQSSAEKANARGARLQYAKARLLEAGAMQNLGIAGYADVRAEAREICAELGDRACVAAAYRVEANNLLATGELRGARRSYEKALEIAISMGNSPEKLNALHGLGYAANLQGDLPQAEIYLRAALPVASQLGRQQQYPIVLDLADVLAQQGHLSEAGEKIEEALRTSQQTGEREGIGLSEAALAHLLELQDKGADALAKYREALPILREVGDPFLMTGTLLDFGNAQLEQGNLDGARKTFDEAAAIVRRYPDFLWSLDLQLAQARLSLYERHYSDAASHSRLALQGFQATGRAGDRLQAAAVLARALIGLGSVTDAAKTVALPAPNRARLPIQSVIQYEMAHCYVLAKTGSRAEVVAATNAMLMNASHYRIPRVQREALEVSQATLGSLNHSADAVAR